MTLISKDHIDDLLKVSAVYTAWLATQSMLQLVNQIIISCMHCIHTEAFGDNIRNYKYLIHNSI